MGLIRISLQWRSVLFAASVVLLAACSDGSDPKPDIQSVVSFGDSLSDVGTYASLTGPNGGKFTINPGPIWVENIASRYGLAITPNIVGYGTDPASFSVCPRPACTGYAQGGARVTDPNGIGKANGALTLPIRSQIANHLAANEGRFDRSELVVLLGGGNDVLAQLSAFAELVPTQGREAALATVQNAIVTAANELVDTMRQEILAKGAAHVVVVNVPSLSQTPFGQKLLDENGRQLADGLVNAFNSTLEKGIRDNQLPVLFFNANAAFNAIYNAPAANGFVNYQDAACDPLKIAMATEGAVTTGSALFCNSATLIPAAQGDSRFQFADSVHPTPLLHKVFSDLVISELSARGWL